MISAGTASYVYSLGRFFARAALSPLEWIRFLQAIFPEVERGRRESAVLARRFYDTQRAVHVPELPRNDVDLEGTTFEAFAKSMDAARPRMSQESAPNDAVANTALRAVRAVEMAGRRQIIRAVEEDRSLEQLIETVKTTADEDRSLSRLIERTVRIPDEVEPSRDTFDIEPDIQPRIVRGWARVATGRETCAWCLMLISRGPVYKGASTAGLDLDDESAVDAFEEAGLSYDEFFSDTEGYVEEWHVGCDCKVVPVFDVEDWPGRSAHKRAEKLWIEATKEAQRFRKENPGRVYKQGQYRGEPVTLNDDVINALRRRLERGDISMTEFAALAA